MNIVTLVEHVWVPIAAAGGGAGFSAFLVKYLAHKQANRRLDADGSRLAIEVLTARLEKVEAQAENQIALLVAERAAECSNYERKLADYRHEIRNVEMCLELVLQAIELAPPDKLKDVAASIRSRLARTSPYHHDRIDDAEAA